MKILTVFGTRPEAIKMAPIVKELEKHKVESKVLVTGQHREMLDQVLEIFNIVPDYDLNIFKPGQSLTEITINSMVGLEKVLEEFKPDLLLIQGDTTTVFAGAIAAFYQKIKIGHVEAGLRSHNLYSPYPEEANRRLTSVLADYHFAPTEENRKNLLAEGIDSSRIFITGNTVIDALEYAVDPDYVFKDEVLNKLDYSKNIALLTCHRRENLGKPMEEIFSAVRDVVEEEDLEIVFPVHLNPKVRSIAREVFGDNPKIHMIEPLDYLPFSNLMNRVKFVITDSGGVQEEAPALGKPVLVVREETERMEGVVAGTAKLIGNKYEGVYSNLKQLINDKNLYESMAKSINPYGTGDAAKKIVSIVLKDC